MDKPLSRHEKEKIKNERTILQHATNLFCLNGYENTTMDMLSKSCEYTKRTIYRYFTCKEDLYFAVLFTGHEELLEIVKHIAQSEDRGKEKIIRIMQVFRKFYTESGYLFDLMSQIKAIRSQKKPDELPYYQKYADCVGAIHGEVISFFTQAREDQSIRADVDVTLLGLSSIFVMNGFFHMLSMTGDSFMSYFELDREQFIDFTMNWFFELLGDDMQ